jgi:hypothetical protein
MNCLVGHALLYCRFLWKVWDITNNALSVSMVVVLSVPRTILQLRAGFIANITMLSSSKRRAIIASLSKLHLSKKYRRINYMSDYAAEV